MNDRFWQGKKVLITGHTGFKGSWLSVWLGYLGAEVLGYALDPPTIPSLFKDADVEKGIESIIGDVRDEEHLTSVIHDFAPEVIFHLAAQSVVRESYTDPIETYSTNVVGTACLFQAVRLLSGHCAIVNVTTDKCYRNREWIWGYREDDELGGHDPYSNSKACAELVTQSFRDSYFPLADLDSHRKAIATARAGNVIGGGDWTPDQLIPDIIRAAVAGKSVLIRNPAAVRPWQHVLDCLSGYILLAARLLEDPPKYIGAWNFGPEYADAKPVSWIVERITNAWGDGASWELDENHHPHEARLLRLDKTKAAEILDWHPRLRLEEALDMTVAWYRSHAHGADAYELCLDQIKRYMSRDPVNSR